MGPSACIVSQALVIIYSLVFVSKDYLYRGSLIWSCFVVVVEVVFVFFFVFLFFLLLVFLAVLASL